MCLFMLLSSSTSLRRSISKHSTISFLLSTISTNLQKNRERVCITDNFRCQFFNNYTNNQSIISRYLCINASSLCLSKSVLVASGWHMRHRIWYSTSACSSSNLCCRRSNINSACRLNSSFFSFTNANSSKTSSSTSVLSGESVDCERINYKLHRLRRIHISLAYIRDY